MPGRTSARWFEFDQNDTAHSVRVPRAARDIRRRNSSLLISLCAHNNRTSDPRILAFECHNRPLASLFDHLVGAAEQRKREGETKRAGSLEVGSTFTAW